MYRHLGINDSMKLEQRRRPMTRETWEANLKYQRRLFGEFADRARYQIARRLWALLDALIADVPKKRRRPSSRRAPCSTTRSHLPYPTASAPTLSSLTAKGLMGKPKRGLRSRSAPRPGCPAVVNRSWPLAADSGPWVLSLGGAGGPPPLVAAGVGSG